MPVLPISTQIMLRDTLFHALDGEGKPQAHHLRRVPSVNARASSSLLRGWRFYCFTLIDGQEAKRPRCLNQERGNALQFDREATGVTKEKHEGKARCQ